MRRRKDITSLLRNIERPLDRNTMMGIASSISGNGKIINGQISAEGEVRDLFIALPYGISSSGVDGIRVQIIANDNQNNVAVGVIDGNRPMVKSGCITIYDRSKSAISLDGEGNIKIVAGDSDSSATFDKDGNINISTGDGDSSVLLDKDGKITINAKTGASIMLDTDGNITIKADNDINIESDKIKIKGDLEVTGTGKLNGREIRTTI